jgi:hypothetical protein
MAGGATGGAFAGAAPGAAWTGAIAESCAMPAPTIRTQASANPAARIVGAGQDRPLREQDDYLLYRRNAAATLAESGTAGAPC